MNKSTKMPEKNDIEIVNLDISNDNVMKLKEKLDEGYVIYDIKNNDGISSFILYKDTKVQEKAEKIKILKSTLKKNMLETLDAFSSFFQNMTGKSKEEVDKLLESYYPSIEIIIDLTFDSEEFLKDITEDPMKIIGLSSKFKSMIDDHKHQYDNKKWKIKEMNFTCKDNLEK